MTSIGIVVISWESADPHLSVCITLNVVFTVLPIFFPEFSGVFSKNPEQNYINILKCSGTGASSGNPELLGNSEYRIVDIRH